MILPQKTDERFIVEMITPKPEKIWSYVAGYKEYPDAKAHKDYLGFRARVRENQ